MKEKYWTNVNGIKVWHRTITDARREIVEAAMRSGSHTIHDRNNNVVGLHSWDCESQRWYKGNISGYIGNL